MAQLPRTRFEQGVVVAVAAALGLLLGGVVVAHAYLPAAGLITGPQPSNAAQEDRALIGVVLVVVLALVLGGAVAVARRWSVLVLAPIALVAGAVLVDVWVIREESHFIAENITYPEAERTLPDLVEAAIRSVEQPIDLRFVFDESGDSFTNSCFTSHGGDTGTARLSVLAIAPGFAPGQRDAVAAALVAQGFAEADTFAATQGDLRETVVVVRQNDEPGATSDLRVNLTTPCLRDR